jgi:phage recombination protein Bet
VNAIPSSTNNSALVTEQDAASLRQTLKNSFYPGAADASVDMVVAYCKAARLDPMTKPVHIVPMTVATGRKDDRGYDIKEKRDIVMPGIGLYRIQASRTGQYAGCSEPEFGPARTLTFKREKWTEGANGKRSKTYSDDDMVYPEWCRITVRRRMGRMGAAIVEFTALEYWLENFAAKTDGSPNAMWEKRPFGQLAKCAEAQALRKAFPDAVGSQPTADEMEGKTIEADAEQAPALAVQMPRAKLAPVSVAVLDTLIEGVFSESPAPIAPAHPAPAAAPPPPPPPPERSVKGDTPKPPPHAAPAAHDGEQGPLSDLSPSQARLIRIKASYAGIFNDADLLAAYPGLGRETINEVLRELSGAAQ